MRVQPQVLQVKNQEKVYFDTLSFFLEKFKRLDSYKKGIQKE